MSRCKKNFAAFAILLFVEIFAVSLFPGSFLERIAFSSLQNGAVYIETNPLQLDFADFTAKSHSVLILEPGAEADLGTQIQGVLVDFFSRPIITPKVSRWLSQSVLIL